MRHFSRQSRFEREVLPHLDAAYSLARWLLRNGPDAEDVTQEACLRAYKAFDGFRGGSAKAWLLAIVRNACYSLLERNRKEALTTPLDDVAESLGDGEAGSPEMLLSQKLESALLRQCLEALPIEYREVLVLRELEELSYKEISEAAAIPLGTVMSRLARGRALLQRKLAANLEREDAGAL